MMLKQTSSVFVVGLLMANLSSAVIAADYSQGSKAKEWGLTDEVKAKFSGKVVDLLCELAGDCPSDCGAGARNLGIVRADDNKLITVLKNRQAAFNGAAEDLLPYCNKSVDVDGVLVGDEEEVKAQFYMVQLIRLSGEEKWNKTTRWTKVWKERNPEAKGKGPWFRRDPRVKKQIAKNGHFGLGHAVDQKYIEENE